MKLILLMTMLTLIFSVKFNCGEVVEYKAEPPERVVKEITAPPIIEPVLTSLGEFKLTAYCSCSKCCDQYALNRPVDENGNEIVIGASGEVLQAGYSIAVDPRVIPYGTVVIINGKEYEAQDCGGAIKNKSIDVYFNNHKEALEFGVQYAEIFIREEI